MKTFEQMRQYEDHEVCQHFFPRKGGFCGESAEYVVGSRGSCVEHLGNLVLDAVGPKGYDEDQVMVFQRHVWDRQVARYGPDLAFSIEWSESIVKRVRS